MKLARSTYYYRSRRAAAREKALREPMPDELRAMRARYSKHEMNPRRPPGAGWYGNDNPIVRCYLESRDSLFGANINPYEGLAQSRTNEPAPATPAVPLEQRFTAVAVKPESSPPLFDETSVRAAAIQCAETVASDAGLGRLVKMLHDVAQATLKKGVSDGTIPASVRYTCSNVAFGTHMVVQLIFDALNPIHLGCKRFRSFCLC